MSPISRCSGALSSPECACGVIECRYDKARGDEGAQCRVAGMRDDAGKEVVQPMCSPSTMSPDARVGRAMHAMKLRSLEEENRSGPSR